MTEDDVPQESWHFESLVGSRVLLGAGLLSLLAGTVFFVKLSSDHQWIPPQVRILCGIAAGLALLVGGAWQLGRARTLVAEGVTGLGASVLYLSLWGAYGPFAFIDLRVAGAAMIAVSAALAFVSWRRASQNVALAGLAGGYLTPLLLQGGAIPQATLALYLVVLSGAMLWLAVRCRYRLVEAASFAAALLYAPVFAPGPGWTQTHCVVTASVLFAEFAAALFAVARRDATTDARRIGLAVVEVAAYVAVLELELGWSPHVLATADAVLGAVLLAAVAFSAPRALRVTYAWLALGVLTRAIDVWGGAHALDATLAIEGAALGFIGIRYATAWMRLCGYGLVALGMAGAALNLVLAWDPHPFFNGTFGATLAVVAALVVLARDVRSYAPLLHAYERDFILTAATVAAAVFAVAGVSHELIAATTPDGVWTASTQTAMSTAWSLLAAVFVAVGFRARFSLVRWLGVALFLATIAKVIAVDAMAMDPMLRAVSALVLGAMLVVVAAGYQVVMLRRRVS